MTAFCGDPLKYHSHRWCRCHTNEDVSVRSRGQSGWVTISLWPVTPVDWLRHWSSRTHLRQSQMVRWPHYHRSLTGHKTWSDRDDPNNVSTFLCCLQLHTDRLVWCQLSLPLLHCSVAYSIFGALIWCCRIRQDRVSKVKPCCGDCWGHLLLFFVCSPFYFLMNCLGNTVCVVFDFF